MKELDWSIKTFNELSLMEFHDIIKLRVDVFVVEQDCPYPDIDELDPPSHHVQGKDADGKLLAYARIIPATEKDPHVHVGRVVTAQHERGTGLGHELMSRTMLYQLDRFPNEDIALAAQSHLTGYYAKHGFMVIGEEYPLDGIPHRDMILKKG